MPNHLVVTLPLVTTPPTPELTAIFTALLPTLWVGIVIMYFSGSMTHSNRIFVFSLIGLMSFTVASYLALGALLTLLDMVISSTAWKDSRKLCFLLSSSSP